MQGAFISALTFAPPTVLGRQLRPFSSWHGLLLEAAGSPYIVGGPVGIDDLVTAAWICSHGFTDGIAIAADAKALQSWGRCTASHNYAAALKEFSDYITASFNAPQYWSSGDGGSLRAPFFWHSATFAMRELHLPEAQAWDYPLAKITCYQSCVAEVNGNKDLMSAEDIKGIDALKADADKEKAEKEKK